MWSSVILPDVAVSLIEQLLIGVELVLEQSAAQFLLHETLALGRVLPVREAHLLYDLVDVGHDAFDDDVGVLALGFFEQLRQGFLSCGGSTGYSCPGGVWRWGL